MELLPGEQNRRGGQNLKYIKVHLSQKLAESKFCVHTPFGNISSSFPEIYDKVATLDWADSPVKYVPYGSNHPGRRMTL